MHEIERIGTALSANPFRSDAALTHSSYAGLENDQLVRMLDGAPASAFARVAHTAFRSFVLDGAFPCLAARAALTRGSYRFGAYERIADSDVTEGLARDLYAFAAERTGWKHDYTAFVATFRAPISGHDPERAFEAALWKQLELLHGLDRPHSAWDPRVSSDPESAQFSFSVAGTAFFIVGMHPASSRLARRFGWPTVIFNAHEQFDSLKRKGQFEGLRMRIRTRDVALSGSVNPNLSDFGERSEARQYSGRAVEEGWTCPYRSH